jgi:hypothetical protein
MIFESIQQELNTAMINTCDDLLKSIQLQIASVNHVKDHAKSLRFKFSDRVCVGDDKMGLPDEMGVYLIFQGESLAYVGYGNISNRVGSFKQVLTSVKTGHRGAMKARKDDANALNYSVSWVIIPDASLADKMEAQFMEDYSPKYCDQKMAGK